MVFLSEATPPPPLCSYYAGYAPETAITTASSLYYVTSHPVYHNLSWAEQRCHYWAWLNSCSAAPRRKHAAGVLRSAFSAVPPYDRRFTGERSPAKAAQPSTRKHRQAVRRLLDL